MSRGSEICVLTLVTTGLLLGLGTTPAVAESERMQLDCEDGRVIERTNGSSWWGANHDAGYVSERLVVEHEGGRYEKGYGSKGPSADRSVCVAEHFGSTWTVDLVRSR